MAFELWKKHCIEKMILLDKSKKGEIDQKMRKVVDDINSSDDFFTTSSCSGRILLIRKERKKYECEWLYLTHGFADSEGAWNILKEKNEGEIWFKQESMILHVCAKTIEKAQELVNLARSKGLKRSGIQASKKKIMLEILNNEMMETIIAKEGKTLTTEDYFKELIKTANSKQKKNFNKIDEFHQEFKKVFLNKP